VRGVSLNNKLPLHLVPSQTQSRDYQTLHRLNKIKSQVKEAEGLFWLNLL